MNLDQERSTFEQAALQLMVTQRAAGVPIVDDDLELPVAQDSVFWRDEKGDYGVKMFNAAWWAWALRARLACDAERETETELAVLEEVLHQVKSGQKLNGTSMGASDRAIHSVATNSLLSRLKFYVERGGVPFVLTEDLKLAIETIEGKQP